MGDQTARGAIETLGEDRRRDARGGRADDHIRSRHLVDLGVELGLHVSALEHALLGVGRAVERVRQTIGDGNARERRVGIVDQAVADQLAHIAGDARERLLGLRGFGIEERYRAPGAGEDDGPGAADEARPQDCDFVGHGFLP